MLKTTLQFMMAGLLASVPAVAIAQEWTPDRPIHLIVPYPAGGTSDMMARLLAPGLGDALGQPVVVENRTGGGGVAGTEVLVRSEPDGYTIGFVASSFASGVHLVPNLPFDPLVDSQPLSMVTRVGVALVVHPDYEAQSLEELIELAKAAPGTIPYGSAGNGLSGHFAGEALKLSADIDMIHIPYAGGAPGLADVVAGHIPMMFNVISSVKSSVDGGNVRPLAVTGAERSSVMPDVPTMLEVGEDVEIYEWYGLIAPAGLPDNVLERLHSELVEVLAQQDFIDRMNDIGIEVVSNTPEEFTDFIQSEIDRFGVIVESAGITLE